MKISTLILSAMMITTLMVTAVPLNHLQLSLRPEVQLLREYIKIDTSTPEGLKPAVDFWRRQAHDVGLKFQVFTPSSLPIVVITWEGTNLTLPSIMLNSHMDVVVADKKDWLFPPFEAHLDNNGDIYGRGTQDTKSEAIQYLEVIRRLKNKNTRLKRTVHITLIPDEEVGSPHGMQPFLETNDFKNLNVGFALDEGLPTSSDTYLALYVDRRPWQIKMTFKGSGGHGSNMPDNTAAEGVMIMMNHLMQLREEQKSIMKSVDETDYGAYTSVNINQIFGGVARNIIPNEMGIVVDIRLGVNVNVTEFKAKLDQWSMEAGIATEYTFITRQDVSLETSLDDTNIYWKAILDAAAERNMKIKPIVLSATSDMLYVRNYGIPAIGFSPFINTTPRIHNVNEYVNANIFLDGIEVYSTIIENLANLH